MFYKEYREKKTVGQKEISTLVSYYLIPVAFMPLLQFRTIVTSCQFIHCISAVKDLTYSRLDVKGLCKKLNKMHFASHSY